MFRIVNAVETICNKFDIDTDSLAHLQDFFLLLHVSLPIGLDLQQTTWLIHRRLSPYLQDQTHAILGTTSRFSKTTTSVLMLGLAVQEHVS